MIPFVKNMLDKIGVKMNVFYAGDFKSATEPFRLTEMSEANKLQTREFLRDMRSIFVDIVSKNRSVSPEKLDTIIANFEGRTANKALKHGLVDVLAYKEEFYTRMKNKTKTEVDKKLKTISLSDYHLITKVDKTEADDKIAVIYLEGEIGYGTDEPGTISDKRYAETLEKIKNDKNIKAVVLRINSPGGSAFSSEIIWKGIEDIKASGKKVVASFLRNQIHSRALSAYLVYCQTPLPWQMKN
jgi:protease-4